MPSSCWVDRIYPTLCSRCRRALIAVISHWLNASNMTRGLRGCQYPQPTVCRTFWSSFARLASIWFEKCQSSTQGGADNNRRCTRGWIQAESLSFFARATSSPRAGRRSERESRGERKADLGARSTCDSNRIADARGRVCSAGWRRTRRFSTPTVFATSPRQERSTRDRFPRGFFIRSIIRFTRWRSRWLHRLSGGEGPSDWQQAAQLAAIFFGVVLVIPLYAIALELFGASRAWLACLFIYLVPFNGHVLADALSKTRSSSSGRSASGRVCLLLPPRSSSGSCRLWPQVRSRT